MADYQVILALIAFLAVSCNGAAVGPRISDSHNIDECNMNDPLNIPLLQTNVYEAAKFLQVVKRTITFTETPDNPQVIKCVRVTNMDTSNHGGYPRLVKGGVGAYDAEILLTSQLGQPLNFRVEIWSAEEKKK